MNYADIRPSMWQRPGIRFHCCLDAPTPARSALTPRPGTSSMERPFGPEQMDQILTALGKSYGAGTTPWLGGEPFHPNNQKTVLELVKRVRQQYPQKDIWCYTGYLFEDLAAGKVGDYGRALLEQLDVLVDGEFVEAEKDLTLQFRGIRNQRILELKRIGRK